MTSTGSLRWSFVANLRKCRYSSKINARQVSVYQFYQALRQCSSGNDTSPLYCESTPRSNHCLVLNGIRLTRFVFAVWSVSKAQGHCGAPQGPTPNLALCRHRTRVHTVCHLHRGPRVHLAASLDYVFTEPITGLFG